MYWYKPTTERKESKLILKYNMCTENSLQKGLMDILTWKKNYKNSMMPWGDNTPGIAKSNTQENSKFENVWPW